MKPINKSLTTISFLSCLICLSGCGFLFPDYHPYTFEVTYSRSKGMNEPIFFDDLDGDRRMEFWQVAEFVNYPNRIILFDESFANVEWQLNDSLIFAGVLPIHNCTFGSKGFPKHLLISRKGKLHQILSLISYDQKTIWERELYRGRDLNGDGLWDGSFNPMLVTDINNDGSEEVLLTVFTAFDLEPRGVWAVNPLDGEILWSYSTGCGTGLINLYDINKDGQDEIILDTDAPTNGAVAGGTDDNHSYLIALESRTGVPLLEEEVGPSFSNSRVSIVDRKEEGIFLVTSVSSSATGADFSRISFWRDWPLKLHNRISLPEKSSAFISYDVDGDGKEEVIVISSAGYVRAYDASGRIRGEFWADYGLLGYGLVDFPEPINGQAVLVKSLESGTLIGLGGGLRPLFSIDQNRITDLVPLESPRLALVTAETVQFGHFVRTPLPIPYRELAFYASGVITVLAILLMLSLVRMPLKWKLLNSEFPIGIIWMDRKGRLRKSNQAARTLIPELPARLPTELVGAQERLNLKKLNILETRFTRGSGQHEQLLSATLRSFLQGTLITITDQTDFNRAKFLRAWGEGIGRIVHAFKSPATTIQMSLKQLKGKESPVESLERIEGQTALLLGYTQRFKKVFSLLDLNPEPLDLNQLIRRVIVPYQASHGERIEFDLQTDDERLIIHADREQLEIMLRCLLDNSVEAIDQDGEIHIRSHRYESIEGLGSEWVKEYAEVEIRDNGPGMDAATLEQVMKPGYTTKDQGMGLGLPQAKLIVELHAGEFNIRSQAGVGVTIYFKLPLLESNG